MKLIKIMIAVPSIGYLHSESAHSLMELMVDITRMESEGYVFFLGVFPRMMVAQAREAAVEAALKVKCDYIFFIDDDMVLPRGILRRLLSHQKDVVGALSWERMAEHKPNIYDLHQFIPGRGEGGKKIGSMKWRNILDYKKRRDKKTGLLKVAVVGFGCVLINTRIFRGKRKIEDPYFMSQFNVGEDFFFCWRCNEKGWEVWADCSPAAQVGHIGNPPILEEDDYIKEYRKKMKELKKEAKEKEEKVEKEVKWQKPKSQS